MRPAVMLVVVATAFILSGGQAWAQAPAVIDNSVVRIVFDHDEGGIDALTYKYGSNRNILDPYWNVVTAGLGSLGCLGEPGINEEGTTVTDYDFGADYATITYANPLYGSKTFDMSWSAAGGVEITFTFDFEVDDDRRETKAIWEPGGDNDRCHDYITVLKADESEETIHYPYPGPWTLIWDGDAYGTVMWDSDYDERIGYRSECYLFTRIANGASADGPYHTMERAGTYTLYFAVKNSPEFEDWFNSFTNSGEPCGGRDVIAATADIDPNTLNCKSKGKYVTCYIELEGGFDPAQIFVPSVMLNGEIRAELHPTEVGDYDNDGIRDRMVKFSRRSLQELVCAADGADRAGRGGGNHGFSVELAVTGELADGTPFEGSDMIRVIHPWMAGDEMALLEVSPVPLSGAATISFELPADGRVTLRVYDAAGRLVRTLADGSRPAGEHEITWDRTTDRGIRAGAGVYFVRLEHRGRSTVQKLLIVN